MICAVKKPGKRNLLWRTVRIVAIIAGLYGGWLLAGREPGVIGRRPL